MDGARAAAEPAGAQGEGLADALGLENDAGGLRGRGLVRLLSEGCAADLADRRQALAGLHVEARHRPHQGLQIRVARVAEDLLPRARLHHAPAIHHHHFVGHVGDDAEIVGDEHQRHARLGLQLLHEVEDLRLRGHVERRRRLVGDEQRRLGDERHGDHGALAEAARQLERIGDERALRVGEADPGEHVDGAGLGLLAADIGVQDERFRDLVADRVQRRQRGHRLLEDHGDAAAPQGAHALAVGAERGDIDGRLGCGRIVEADGAGADAGRLRQDAQDGLRRHGLAGPGFADDGHGLAVRDVEGQPVDGAEIAAVGMKIDREIADRQERFLHPAPQVVRTIVG